MIVRPLGYRRGTPRASDRCLSSIRPKLERLAVSGDEYRIPLHRLPRNQTGNSCTANAWCGALETVSDLTPTPLPDLAAQGLYWCERERNGETGVDNGAYIRNGAEVLQIFGVAQASTWPDSDATLFDQPDPAYFVNGEDGKIGGAVLAESLDDLDTAIRANHPPVYGVDVGADFTNWDGLDASRVFDAPASPLGGHAMYLVGVRGTGDAREFLTRTSWGAFGLQGMGLAWFSAAYVATSLGDVWVATRST